MKKLINSIVVAAAMVAAMSTGASADDELINLVAQEARNQKVPVALAVAVAQAESTFNCKAYNKSGAIGLMQIKLATAKSMGYAGSAKGLYDCATNAHFGVKYLKAAMHAADGNHCHAATLYNRGIYAKPKSSGYCKKVLRIAEQY